MNKQGLHFGNNADVLKTMIGKKGAKQVSPREQAVWYDQSNPTAVNPPQQRMTGRPAGAPVFQNQ